MPEQLWSQFVIYVNAYYAVQEAHDSARRMWKTPAAGLAEFCRDANPFLWDDEGSAEESVYDSFTQGFSQRFPERECGALEGLVYARTWLASMEGDRYGHDLVSSLDAVTDDIAWEEACETISEQLVARAARLARSPQDEPMPVEETEPHQPSAADIEAVIAMLAKGDEAFAASLRERLANEADSDS